MHFQQNTVHKKLYMLLHTNCTCYCIQIVHVTAYKLYMLLHTICTCYCIQSVHVTAYKLYMLLHTICTCYFIQTVHVTAYNLYMLLYTICTCYCIQSVHVPAYKGTVFFINHINCLIIRKHVLSILLPNMVACYLHTGVLSCHSYVLGNLLGHLSWRLNEVKFLPFKIMGHRLSMSFLLRTYGFQERITDVKRRWL